MNQSAKNQKHVNLTEALDEYCQYDIIKLFCVNFNIAGQDFMDHNLNSLVELERQISARLLEFNAKRASNQKHNKFFSLSQMILAFLTTLLIALNAKASFFAISMIAIFTSSLGGLAGQILSKYMYQERMSMNIKTVCALYELAHTITMDRKKEEDDSIKHRITLEKVDKYQTKYQSILDAANGQWQQQIQKPKK
ncbi:hypothetical protein EMIT0P100_60172 [Pseudomonas sp. IT-P100]|uniref:hypothetical protein n=1 Tax=Pseudomonas sp. IT-P100 TaxID=3026452 RepID=UPI0039E1DC20